MTVSVKIRFSYQLSLFATHKIHLQVQSLVQCARGKASLNSQGGTGNGQGNGIHSCTPLPTHAAAVLPSTPSTFPSTHHPSSPVPPKASPAVLYHCPSSLGLVSFYDYRQLSEARKVYLMPAKKYKKITASILTGFCFGIYSALI